MKYKIIVILVIVFVISALSSPTFGAEKLYRIAVLPFDDGSIKERWWGDNWQVGDSVSDELVTALVSTNKFRVIEREQINQVLQEQNMGLENRLDAHSAAKIGRILGVQYLIIGRVTEFSVKSNGGAFALGNEGFGFGIKTTVARVAIDARLVDTTTAEIRNAVSGKGEKSNTNLGLMVKWNTLVLGSDEFEKTNLGAALRNAVAQVSNGLAACAYEDVAPDSQLLNGRVFYSSGRKVIINLGANDGVTPGMIFIVDHVLDDVRDPNTGELVDEVTEPVAEIIVGEVKDKTSTCTVKRYINAKFPISIRDKVKQIESGGGNQ